MEPVSVVDNQSETGAPQIATGVVPEAETRTEAGLITSDAGDAFQIDEIRVDETRTEPVPQSVVASATVFTPGEILKKAREARGESLSNVAQVLKLSAQQLRALESGKLDALPGLTFARGFLRNYARYLNVDPEPLLASLDNRTSIAVDDLTRASSADKSKVAKSASSLQTIFTPRARSAPRAQEISQLSQARSAPRTRSASGRNMFSILLTVLVLVAVAGAVFFLGGVKFFQYEPAASGVERPTTRIENVLPPPSPVSMTASPPAPPRQTVEVVSADGLTANTLSLQAQPAPASTAEPVSGTNTATVPTAPSTDNAVPGNDVTTLRFSFSVDALVQVRGKNGKIIFSRVGSKGRTYNVQVKDNLPVSLMIKQANKVKLDFNGIPIDLKPHTNREGVARLSLQ